MRNSSNVILAIYPNARGFGYALFETPTDPQDCGMVSILPICNKKSFRRIKKLLEHYEPTLIVLQDFKAHSRKSLRVKKLVSKVIDFCHANRLPVKEYSHEQIRFVFGQFKSHTKHQIAEKIIEWLPQFENKIPYVRKPWMCEDYHMGMFDAMALALTHFYIYG